MPLRYSIDQNNSAWRIVDGEAVLINAETTFYYGLNWTATRIWKLLLEEDLTAEEIAERIASDFGKSSTEVIQSVGNLLDELTVETILTAQESVTSRSFREEIPRGPSEGEGARSQWEIPQITRYDTLEELIVCGE